MNARRPIILTAWLLAVVAVGSAASGARAQGNDAMQWSIIPYLWATDTAVDLTYRGQDIGSDRTSFGDLMDMMDSAFMVHVEGGKGHWSGFVNYTYLSVSDRDRRQLVTIDSSSRQVYVDAAMAFWPAGVGSNLSFHGGVRHTGLDDQFKFKRTSDETLLRTLRSDKDYTDALLGLRYRWDLSQRWSLLVQGDASFGSTQGSWLFRGLFGYTVGQREANKILFGYQYKVAEYEDGDLGLDYTYDGPLAGFSFRF